MNDLTPAFVRTAVPLIVGPLVARFGFNADDPTVTALLAGVIGWLYYVAVRLIELKAPTFGYLLGIAKAPAYSHQPPPQPAPQLAEDHPASGIKVYAGVIPSGAITAERFQGDDGMPEQTDNTPRPEDGEQYAGRSIPEWSGQEMR